MSLNSGTFIDMIEDISREVSDWGVEYIQTVVKALSPDGRPFGMEELDEEEQVGQYLELRGSTEAWTTWINDRSLNIVERLTFAGVSDEQIFTVKPFDIAEQMALAYSVRMEKILSNAT